MIGVRAGDAVLAIGAGDAALVAEVARVTGLNGRVVVADPDATAAVRVERAAVDAGALLEFHHAPEADRFERADRELGDSFDLVLVQRPLAPLDEPARRAVIAGALSHARPGGRVMILLGARATGWLWASAPAGPTLTGGEAEALLVGAGALAARTLGTLEGITYVEARGRNPV
jgi:SAM-dependent methyltransferase